MVEKYRVLIVDDDKEVAEVHRMRLEGSGKYEVRVMLEARNIINEVHLFKPHLIILDLLMPGMGGLDACRMLNDDPEGVVIPIIVVSGDMKEVDKIEALKLGVVDYLVKDFDSTRFLSVVEKAIHSKLGD